MKRGTMCWWARALLCWGVMWSSLTAANFNEANRWTATATDGVLSGIGAPMTLTWSIVADGLTLPAVYTDPATNPGRRSNLVATFDDHYAVPVQSRTADLTQRVWFAHMQTVFARYAIKTGITYVYVADDGAAWGAAGQFGARGDVRIAGTALTGVLGYNGFPPGGDMVLNTDFAGFASPGSLMVVFGHEHAHGLGLGHVVVAGSNSLSVVAGGGGTAAGPQLDDLSVLLRAYGDFWEKGAGDDAPENARHIGTLSTAAAPAALSVGTQANDLAVLATDTDFAYSGGVGDVDHLRFTAPHAQRVAVRLAPQGPAYAYLPEGGTEATINLSAQADLGLELRALDGASLAVADATGVGLTETLTFDLPAAGDYLVRVGNRTAKGQFYRIDVGGLAAFDAAIGARLRSEFTSAGNTEGWAGATNLDGFTAVGGVLTGTATSGDPFFSRTGLALAGGSATAPGARHVFLRFRSRGGSGGQLKWTTAARPGFAEERNIDFAYVGDDTWQVVALDLSAHPLWVGQTITGLRIDPSTTSGAVFELDHVRVSDGDFDGDGRLDFAEGFFDTDADGLADYEDLDADGDGAPDAVERTRGTDARAPRLAFEFDNAGDFEGWNASLNQLAGPVVADGVLRATSSGGDGYATRRFLDFPAGAAPFLVLRARASGGTALQLFWATAAANGFAAARRLDLPLVGDGSFRTVVVDLRAVAEWAGTITQLRLDWPATSGIDVEIDYLRSTEIDGDHDGDGLPDAWEVANGFDLMLADDARLDADGDGMDNLAEYLAGTAPRDPADRLVLALTGLAPPRLEFFARPGRSYAVQRSTTLAAGSWAEIARLGPFGDARPVEFADPAPPSGDRVFYRLVLLAP